MRSAARDTALVIDTDPDSRASAHAALELEGYEVLGATDGPEALSLIVRRQPSVVVADLTASRSGALELLRALVEHPLDAVVITGEGLSSTVRARMLELGADDVVDKPCHEVELVARVQAVLRRSRGRSSTHVLEAPGLRVDRDARRVEAHGVDVELTAKEFDLLVCLAERPGRVLTRSQLLAAVWRSSSRWQGEGTVTEHVHRLRAKIEHDPARPQWIVTVRGVGYRFDSRDSG